MTTTVETSHAFKNRRFEVGELARGLDAIRREVVGVDAQAEVMIIRTLPGGGEHTQQSLPLSALGETCDLKSQGTYVYVRMGGLTPRSMLTDSTIALDYSEILDALVVKVSACDSTLANALLEGLRLRFSLKKAAPTSGKGIIPRLDQLDARVSALERGLATVVRPTCFLSSEFDDGPADSYARSVEQFLGLLDVKVITGRDYEPRSVSQKVRSRLASGVDMIAVIQLEGSKSDWVRDEMANGDVYRVVLLEGEAQLTPGIHGDLEYIRFPKGHVAEAFIKLTQGVSYVRREMPRGRAEAPAADA